MSVRRPDERAQETRASSFAARPPAASVGPRTATFDHRGTTSRNTARDVATTWRPATWRTATWRTATWRTATWRTATWRTPVWPLFLLGFALLCLGLLIGPRLATVDDAGYNCVGSVHLAGPFGFELNCDSPEFMWLARDPAGLINHLNSRQSRPGLILLAALIQAPLSLVMPPEGPPTPVYQGLYDPLRVAQTFIDDRPAYFAYLILNFTILFASFHFLRLTIERGQPTRSSAGAIIVVATGLLVVANDVTKAFFWSPHTQMLNILVPVFAVYATQRVVADARIQRPFALAVGTLVGLGMTAYPVFVVIPACMLLPAIVGLLREESPAVRRRDLVSLALLGVLSALPWALWYLYVRLTTGQFSSAEIGLKQVIWMKDALANGLGAFLSQWFDYLWELLAFAAPQAVALAALVGWVAVTLVVALLWRRIERTRLTAALPIIAIGLYVSCAVLGFYTCVGWLMPRLGYPVIPPLMVAAGATATVVARQLAERPRSIFAGGCLALALVQIIYEAAKQGPWS